MPSGSLGRGMTVVSSAYCLTGTMANGDRVHAGAAASRRWRLGTRLQLADGTRVTITDRTAAGAWSGLDIWMADCDAAIAYGRRTIIVRVIA